MPPNTKLVGFLGSVESLRKTAGDNKSAGANAARRLADALSKLAESNQATREKAQAIFVEPLKIVRDSYRDGREAYEAKLILVRPDRYVAWIADSAPGDAAAIIGKAVGRA